MKLIVIILTVLGNSGIVALCLNLSGGSFIVPLNIFCGAGIALFMGVMIIGADSEEIGDEGYY